MRFLLALSLACASGFYCHAQPCVCNCGCAVSGQCNCGGGAKIKDPYILALDRAKAEDKPVVAFIGCAAIEVDWAVTLKKNTFAGYNAGDVVIMVWSRAGSGTNFVRTGDRKRMFDNGRPYEWAVVRADRQEIDAKRPVKKLLGYTGCETGKCTPVREWTDPRAQAEENRSYGTYPTYVAPTYPTHVAPNYYQGYAPAALCPTCPNCRH